MRWLVVAILLPSTCERCVIFPLLRVCTRCPLPFSDNGGLFYYRLLEAAPDGKGTRVRYSRIAPVTVACPRLIVQSTEARLAEPIPRLLGMNNPCAIDPKRFKSTVAKLTRRMGTLETISFGIASHCGPSTSTP